MAIGEPACQAIFDGGLGRRGLPTVPSLGRVPPDLRCGYECQDRGRPADAQARGLVAAAPREARGFRQGEREEQLELQGITPRFRNGVAAVDVESRGEPSEG